MEILEYKMDANHEGNEITPGFVNHSDCGHFYNPANHSFIGMRLSERVKVPDSITKLTRQQLKDRCQVAGIMMKAAENPEDPLVQMSETEINDAIDAFCDARDIA